MDIQLKKLGNSIGFLIPAQIVESLGLDENSIVEMTESKGSIIINKKQKISSLDELLSSITDDFQYPEDVRDFVESEPLGQEII